MSEGSIIDFGEETKKRLEVKAVNNERIAGAQKLYQTLASGGEPVWLSTTNAAGVAGPHGKVIRFEGSTVRVRTLSGKEESIDLTQYPKTLFHMGAELPS